MSKWTQYRDHLVTLAVEQYRSDRDAGYGEIDPQDMAHEWADGSEAVIYTHQYMDLCAEGDEDLMKYIADALDFDRDGLTGSELFDRLQQTTVYLALFDHLCSALENAEREYENELIEAR